MDTFAISIAVSIGLGVSANLLTDPIKAWLTSLSRVSKYKRISDLEKEIEYLASLHGNPQNLLVESLRQFIQGTILLFLAIGAGIFGTAALIMIHGLPPSGVFYLLDNIHNKG